MLGFIYARDRAYGIGNNNTLPWRCDIDLAVFKRITLNATIIMGRKTFESIGSRPLKDRMNFVLTKTLIPKRDLGIITEVEHIREVNAQYPLNMYWIIGGAQLFKELIDDVSYIHETVIENYFTCDTYVQPIPKHFVRCYYFNKCQYLRTIKDGKVIEDDLSEDEYDPPTERFSMRLFHNSEKERYIGFEQELEAIVGKTITRDSVFQHYPIKRGLPYEYHSEPRAQGTSNSNSEVY